MHLGPRFSVQIVESFATFYDLPEQTRCCSLWFAWIVSRVLAGCILKGRSNHEITVHMSQLRQCAVRDSNQTQRPDSNCEKRWRGNSQNAVWFDQDGRRSFHTPEHNYVKWIKTNEKFSSERPNTNHINSKSNYIITFMVLVSFHSVGHLITAVDRWILRRWNISRTHVDRNVRPTHV